MFMFTLFLIAGHNSGISYAYFNDVLYFLLDGGANEAKYPQETLTLGLSPSM